MLLETFNTSGFVLKSQATRDYVDRLDTDVMVGSSPSEQSKLHFEIINASSIFIKSDNGKYLSRASSNWIVANRDTADDSCVFEVEEMDGKISLKADNGKYLTRCCGGNVIFNAGRDIIDVWSHFTVEAYNVTSGT